MIDSRTSRNMGLAGVALAALSLPYCTSEPESNEEEGKLVDLTLEGTQNSIPHYELSIHPDPQPNQQAIIRESSLADLVQVRSLSVGFEVRDSLGAPIQEASIRAYVITNDGFRSDYREEVFRDSSRASLKLSSGDKLQLDVSHPLFFAKQILLSFDELEKELNGDNKLSVVLDDCWVALCFINCQSPQFPFWRLEMLENDFLHCESLDESASSELLSSLRQGFDRSKISTYLQQLGLEARFEKIRARSATDEEQLELLIRKSRMIVARRTGSSSEMSSIVTSIRFCQDVVLWPGEESPAMDTLVGFCRARDFGPECLQAVDLSSQTSTASLVVIPSESLSSDPQDLVSGSYFLASKDSSSSKSVLIWPPKGCELVSFDEPTNRFKLLALVPGEYEVLFEARNSSSRKSIGHFMLKQDGRTQLDVPALRYTLKNLDIVVSNSGGRQIRNWKASVSLGDSRIDFESSGKLALTTLSFQYLEIVGAQNEPLTVRISSPGHRPQSQQVSLLEPMCKVVLLD